MQSVLITGCSSGIGRCSADYLRQRGYRVLTTARQPSDLASLRQDGFEAWPLDLADSAQVAHTADAILAATDHKLYGLFNNGAYGLTGAVEDISREALEAQFASNVFGWHQLTRAVLPSMRAQNAGRIIQNSSVLGLCALGYRGAYSASKYAIEALSDALRIELADTRIQVSLIEPGPIRSQFRHNALRVFHDTIAWRDSVHHEAYRRQLERLDPDNPGSSYTLDASAVAERVYHALHSPKPKIRYPVTRATHYLRILKRLLPDRQLDKVLRRID